MSSRKKQENIAQALIRLETKLSEGDFYEALQIYDFIFKRYNSQGEEENADAIAKAGALLFIEKNELSNATRMIVLLVESYEKRDSTTIKEKDLAVVKEIVDALWDKIGSKPSKVLIDVLKILVRWSALGESSGRGGDPYLNGKLAATYGLCGDYSEACRHYANTTPDDMEAYASLLKDYAAIGYQSETPIFASRAVLHLLAIKQAAAAAALVDRLESWNMAAPLWNCAKLLCQLCQIAEGETHASAFKLLQDRYRSSLDRDPELVKYVYKIGKHYFNVQPPAGAEDGDILGNLMKMLTS